MRLATLDLLPNGALTYLAGGALIGLAVGFVRLATGRLAGLSSPLTSIHSLWSRGGFFGTPEQAEDLRWKSLLLAGLLTGAALSATFVAPYAGTLQPWRLAVGGILVGFGTRWSRGCTSGHGVCGLASQTPSSLAATLAFFVTGIAVAQLVMALGVTP